jgi:pilus retraction protein PilT
LAGPTNPIPNDEFSFRDVADSLKSPAKPPAVVEAKVAEKPPARDDRSPGLAPKPPAPADASPLDALPGEPSSSKSSASGPPPGPGPNTPLDGTAHRAGVLTPRYQLEAWLALMVTAGASDLILRAGGRPSHRVDGKIGFFPGRVPAAGPLLEVLEGIMGKERMATWRETGSADAALHLDGLGRFRLNAYRQMGEPAVVLRRINEQAPSIEKLELPADNLKKLALRKRGLILVTGIAGSGKSTTLAGMIQHMNETVERHVVTLEDPVELLFTENRCVISQREVGTDCTSFQNGLRHALRQSPDVILIGEMRDAETVNAALDATETGHLVMSTLHTVNAPQTVERILSFFPGEQHPQVRQRIADNLAGVLSQRLIARTGGKGMIPAYELMVSTPHIRELLMEGKTGEIGRVIDQGTERGLISFNMCLRRLVQERKVELNDALAASDRPEELVLALRGITGSAARVDTKDAGKLPPGTDGLRLAKRE